MNEQQGYQRQSLKNSPWSKAERIFNVMNRKQQNVITNDEWQVPSTPCCMGSTSRMWRCSRPHCSR